MSIQLDHIARKSYGKSHATVLSRGRGHVLDPTIFLLEGLLNEGLKYIPNIFASPLELEKKKWNVFVSCLAHKIVHPRVALLLLLLRYFAQKYTDLGEIQERLIPGTRRTPLPKQLSVRHHFTTSPGHDVPLDHCVWLHGELAQGELAAEHELDAAVVPKIK